MPGLSWISWMLTVAVLTGVFHIFTDASGGIHVDTLLQRYDQANSLDTTRALLTQSISKAHTYNERGALSRRKRDILFPNGVKLCSQETVQQVIDNHLSYFHLRVCQETVWEAFKIFWDRLPERDEYQVWMDRCQDGSASVFDIGRGFSQSEEHLTLVQNRVLMASSTSEPFSSWPDMCRPDSTASPKEETIQTTTLEDIQMVVTDLEGDSAPDPPLETEVEQATPEPAAEEVSEGPIAGTDLHETPEDTDAISPETTEEAVEQAAVEEISPVDISEEAEDAVKDVVPDVTAEASEEEITEETPVDTEVGEEVSEEVSDDDRGVLKTAEEADSEGAYGTPEVGEVIVEAEEETAEPTEGIHEEAVSPEEDTAIEESPDEGEEESIEEVVPSEETVEEVVIESELPEQVVTEEAIPEEIETVEEEPEETVTEVEEPEESVTEELPEEAVHEEESPEEVVPIEDDLPEVGVEEEQDEVAPSEELSTEKDDHTATEDTLVEAESDVVEEAQESEAEETPEDTTSEIYEEEITETAEEDAPSPVATEDTAGAPEEVTPEVTEEEVVPEAAAVETSEEELPEAEEAAAGEDEDAASHTPEGAPIEEAVVEDTGETAVDEVIPDTTEEDSPEEATEENATEVDKPPEIVVTDDAPETVAEEDGSDTVAEPETEAPGSEEVTVQEDIEDIAVEEEPPQTIESVDITEEPTTTTTTEAPMEEIIPEEENMITNEIDDIVARPIRPMGEHIVELSVKLKGEFYDDALRDPSSYFYQRLADQFTQKIEDAFERLPGFRSVFVLEFRPQKDIQGGLGVVVHYAITLEGDRAGLSNETMDYITLQSNFVEDSYHEPDEIPTVVYTITDFRNYITEALHKENFIGNTTLDVDPDSLQLENVETLLPVRPTGRAIDSNNLDDVLAAEKPPEVPGQDITGNDLFLKKEDFLFDPVHPYDPWVGSQSDVASENDVLSLEESFTLAPASTKGDVADESLDFGSGSGFSGDEQGPDVWPWEPETSPLDEDDSDVTGESLEKPEAPHEPEQEATPEQEPGEDSAIEEPFLEHRLVTQDIRTHPQYITTDQAPVRWTMETLNVELSMQTVEASGMYDDYYPSEPTVMYFSVTDVPLPEEPPTSEVVLIEQSPEVAVTEPSHNMEALEVTPHDTSAIVSEDQEATEDVRDVDAELPAAVSVEEVVVEEHDFDPDEQPETGDLIVIDDNIAEDDGGVEILEETGKDIELPTSESSPGDISNEDLTEDEMISVSVATALPAPTTTTQSTPLSPEKESPFTRISNTNPDDEETSAIFPSTTEFPLIMEEASDETPLYGIDTESYIYFDETEPLEEEGDDDSLMMLYEPTSSVTVNITHDASDLIFFGDSEDDTTMEIPTPDAHTMDVTEMASIAMPINPGKALMVFFSLRVTNMRFSDDLFNKSSAEYKSLEQRFLELLVPYLQSNLSNFENLEILNFRNGSVVVNSRMKFGKPVRNEVTTVVYLILEDFCNTAYQTMNLAIDKYSLDVESGEKADPCKFQACNEYSRCAVNRWSGEAECVCDPGYFSVDSLPCQSICDLQEDFCQNDGKCDIIPGKGAICRCRVGENWWYRGERCEEYVSEPMVVGIAIASVAGFLLVASGVIFFLARTLRDDYDKDDSEDPLRHGESEPSLERATKYNPMFESDIAVGYNQYYRRYPDMPGYSNVSTDASNEFCSEEIKQIYENSQLSKEEIEERIRVIELYTKDQQFADFMRQHQVILDNRRDSTSSI
ncbi:interphotoreceptor matrix proteoglycan 2-like isoform X1 [Alosa alosa]|uniref:interphotoreceptor matrix proteoglycan 2-like isoform X1 n=1 Tax=Alosa alosa TaxID=278164 RepID=UPI0020153270|nr:interphotoreceptor matrix proteoglycan 2-like isoform X1 [Alosa alosa]